MSEGSLLAALANTLSPNASLRREAEKFLADNSQLPGFSVELLKIVVQDGVPSHLKVAAAVQLKNLIRVNWSMTAETLEQNQKKKYVASHYYGNTPMFVLQPQDKSLVRGNIIEALARAQDNSTRKVLAETIETICITDFPTDWPEVVGASLQQIMTQEPTRMLAAMVIFDKLASTQKRKIEPKERVALHEFMGATFPLLRNLMETILNQNVNDLYAAEICKRMAKIFEKCVFHGIPSFLMDESVAHAWADIFARILQKEIPETVLPQDHSERQKFPWWKAKRRAAMAIEVLLSRYGFPPYVKEDYRPFCTIVVKPQGLAQKYCVPLALQIMRMAYVDKRYCSEAVLVYMFRILEDAVQFSHLFIDMKGQIEWLLRDVLIPAQRWTSEQLEDWNADPHSFLFEYFTSDYELASVFDGSTVSERASTCLEMFCRTRKRYCLPLALTILGEAFMRHKENQQNASLALEKSGAVMAMAAVAHLLRRDSSLDIKSLLLEHIFPDTQSPFAFLRLSACRCISKFIKHDWSTPDIPATICRIILTLIQDSDIVVQVEAAIVFDILLRKGKDPTRAIILDNLPNTVRKLLELTQQTSVDNVFQSLRHIIASFPVHLLPFAKDLARQLAEAFFRIGTESEDDDLAAMMAASRCLQSLEMLISALSLEENNEGENPVGRKMLMEISPIVIPLLNLIFAIGGCDGFEKEKTPLDRAATAAAAALFPNGGLPIAKLDFADYFDTALLIMHLISYHLKAAPDDFWRYVPILIRYCSETKDPDVAKKVLNNLETMVHYEPAGFFMTRREGINTAQIAIEFVVSEIEEFIHNVAKLDERFNDEDDDDEEDGDWQPKPPSHHDEEGDVNLDDDFENMLEEEDDTMASFVTFLLCTLFQVSKSGEMDVYVKPILDVTVKALNAPIAKHEVVVEFITVVLSAIYYNTELALSALGPDNLNFVISMLLDFCDSFDAVCEKMIGILGLTKLLALPPSSCPPCINSNRSHFLSAMSMFVTGLDTLRADIARAKAEEESKRKEALAKGEAVQLAVDEYDDSDEEEVAEIRRPGATDVPEQANVFDFDNDESAENFENLHKMTEQERLNHMAELVEDEIGDDDNEDDAVSPVDSVDEFLFLFDVMQHAHPEAKSAFEVAHRELGAEDQEAFTIIQKMVQEGQRRANARGN